MMNFCLSHKCKSIVILFISVFAINNLYSQCIDNSNYWEESWVSCNASPSPNSARGNSHWLLYEFTEPQDIYSSKIWNANRTGESGRGAKEVYVDVSIDGETWIQLGTEAFTFSQATEAIDYDGFEGPSFSDFDFIEKILFTVVSNHDNSNCVSIAEVQFNIDQDACYGIEDECQVCDGPGLITWYEDADGDGLGNPNSATENCEAPIGYVENDEDPCDNGLYGWADMQLLFEENGCTGCHGTSGASGLDLTTYEGITAGGDICGTNILSGNTLTSIITVDNYDACTSPISFPSMNQRVGDAMDDNEITMIQEWIDAGAPNDCNCPDGSPDSDNDGICDASDDCPNFDNSLIGTPCDDGIACTFNDTYISTCECVGQEIVDSDLDGVCDSLDLAPLNPCTADGIIDGAEPAGWVISPTNDCDEDGVLVSDNDFDDFDSCINNQGISLAPECSCPDDAIQAGGKFHASLGVWETTAHYAEGLPDGKLTEAFGWENYIELSFPYMEIGQEICFDIGFGAADGGVQFEVNELGKYKFYNSEPAKTNYEIQQFCFDVFVAGEQLIRVTSLVSSSIKIDGSLYQSCNNTVDSNAIFVMGDFSNTPFQTPVVGDVSTNDWGSRIGDAQTFTLVNEMPAAEGTLIFNIDGTYNFTPNNTFSGETSFVYEMCSDGILLACDTAKVFIEVLPKVSSEGNPVIANFDANMVKVGYTAIGNVLANDYDSDEEFLAVTTSLNGATVSGKDKDGNIVADAGVLTLLPNGDYTFIPTGIFTGKVIQAYTISTASAPAKTDNAILEITVINDTDNTTFAHDDATITDKGIQVSDNLMQNDEDVEGNLQQVASFKFDSDGDGDTETIGIIENTTTIGGTNSLGVYVPNAGNLTVSSDGAYLFNPAADFIGNIILTYTICDDASPIVACDEATLDITILNALRDYGNISTLYPSAWHRALTDNNDDGFLDGTSDVWLGNSTTVETDMEFDNNDDAMTFGNESGDFPISPMPNTEYDIDIMVNSTGPDFVFYGLWIDWDGDGIYDDFYSGSQVTASPATATKTITTPEIVGSEYNIRLRADDDPLIASDYQGGKTNGEVEDYQRGAVLPVELVSFEGMVKECMATLNWKVASEESFSHYEIERSEDGTNFSTIKKIEGTNTNSTKYYRFEDKAIQAENYYRLKMIDLDGSYEYSNVISLTSDCNESNLNLFPNPASISDGKLYVNVQANKEKLDFRVIDVLGRTVKTFSTDVEVGIMNTITLDISGLAEGSYFLTEGNGRRSKIFILME